MSESTTPEKSKEPATRKPGFQFSLRGMMLLTAAICIVLAVGSWAGFLAGYIVAAVFIVAWIWYVTRAWDATAVTASFLLFLGTALLPTLGPHAHSGRRVQCINNLRQLGQGLLAYESVYGSLPPAYTTDATGRPLHSWRSHILPQISQQRLYDALDFSQPWNARANGSLAPQLPMFQCPSTSGGGAKGPYTSFVAVTGPETMWPDGQCRRLDEVRDGLGNTILLVETPRTDIAWGHPRDLTLEEVMTAFENDDASGAGGFHHGGFNVVFADGHAEFIVFDRIDAATLRALFTANGGEEVVFPTP